MNRILLSLVSVAGVVMTASEFATAQFSADPTTQLQLTSSAGAQSKIRANPLGGYYVAWQGLQGAGDNTYIQRLDADGNAMWAAGGVQVTDAQYTSSFEEFGFDVDAQGNAMVAYRDNHTGTVGIYLQKVTPSGTTPWGINGVPIPGGPAGSTDSPHSPGVTCLSDGGYAVRFSRGTTTASATSRACYQKVDANGNLLWNGGQAIVFTPATNGYFAVDMAPSDNGSVIVFYYTIGTFTTSRRIQAQKMDSATGASLWNGGNPLVIQLTSTVQVGSFPQVISDGGNGAIVTWYELPTNAYQCMVQHVDSSGNILFPNGGATATSGTIAGQMRVSPSISYNPTTQTTYMFYSETNTSQGASGIGCQAFGATGARQWGDNGVQLVAIGATGHSTSFARSSLTTDGAIGTWFESDNSGSTHTVRACRVDGEAGQPAWATPIIDVNTSSAAKSRLDVYSTASGPTIATYGNNGVVNVHASRINQDGTLGNPGLVCGTSDFDGDGDSGTDADIEAFFACLGGNCCALCFPGGSDFNGDGDFGTDRDIESFFSVLGGSTCLY